jgi:EAL domain-containing protein (putative c-di-GMP-specific phosphodiesterase class I)/GGDEF domain-containing protein
MKARERRGPIGIVPPEGGVAPGPEAEEVERLRREALVFDGVTGLPVHPFEDPGRAARLEALEHVGVIYLQIGKFFGFEEIYGWEQYDRVLTVVADGLREDVAASRLSEALVSIRFSGADGFYLLFDLSSAGRARHARALEALAARFQSNAVRRLRQTFGGTTADRMSIHVSSLAAPDNPRSRPSRHLVRLFAEAAKIVSREQTREQIDLSSALKGVLGQKQLRAVFQPVCRLSDGGVAGYEALIRGPAGTPLEAPNSLFAVAHENALDVELETLCLETIFGRLPGAVGRHRLFVNASAMLLRHPVFLDQRHLAEINRKHPDVVVEISEKEMVGDYPAFRETLDIVRRSHLKIAIDDAGSGYSGLEAILYLQPDYIKVADSLVRGLESDPIKREIISSLASIGRRIGAEVIAEGIERRQERRALLDLGITLGQGFLLGRPASQVGGRARPASH